MESKPEPNLSNTEVTLRPVANQPKYWTLVGEVDYIPPMGPEIVVPSGYITDLASVPRLFWNILPPFGRYTAAAVIHDYLYSTQTGTRSYADSVFLSAMKELKVSRWKRWTMYTAVRTFGWAPWRAKTSRMPSKDELG